LVCSAVYAERVLLALMWPCDVAVEQALHEWAFGLKAEVLM